MNCRRYSAAVNCRSVFLQLQLCSTAVAFETYSRTVTTRVLDLFYKSKISYHFCLKHKTPISLKLVITFGGNVSVYDWINY